MDISARTQMAFDILTGLKAELPNRFDREIANARQRSTTLISDGKDWDAGNALWQLVGDIQRQIAPQYFYNARTVVAVARRLRSRGLEKLEATLTDANSALDRGDYGTCVKKCRGVIEAGEQANAQAQLVANRPSYPAVGRRIRLFG